MAFELQTPKERLRFFNVTNYPSLSSVAAAVQGSSASRPLTSEQRYAKGMYERNLSMGNYNHIEKDKFFPLVSRPVDTEASMRKLEQGLLFRSLGPQYSSVPMTQPRVFGGFEPLPFGQFFPDPQSYNITGGRTLDLY
jgi:hypothetical protein